MPRTCCARALAEEIGSVTPACQGRSKIQPFASVEKDEDIRWPTMATVRRSTPRCRTPGSSAITSTSSAASTRRSTPRAPAPGPAHASLRACAAAPARRPEDRPLPRPVGSMSKRQRSSPASRTTPLYHIPTGSPPQRRPRPRQRGQFSTGAMAVNFRPGLDSAWASREAARRWSRRVCDRLFRRAQVGPTCVWLFGTNRREPDGYRRCRDPRAPKGRAPGCAEVPPSGPRGDSRIEAQSPMATGIACACAHRAGRSLP